MNNIRYEVSQGVSMCPKTVSSCLESISVKAHIVTGTSSISQLQALATGICSIQILILARSTLFSGT